MGKINNIIHVTLNSAQKLQSPSRKVNSEAVQRKVSKLPGFEAANLSRNPVFAFMQFHKDVGGSIAFGKYPQNYVKLKSREFISAEPAKIVKLGGREYFMKAREAHYNDIYEMLPSYHVDKLWTRGKGTGTRSIQSIVQKSLADAETQGRVTLEAACLDAENAPGGFYYKLGFRFVDDTMNTECAKWIKNGGKFEEAPFAVGAMYLPKENISHCLNYGKI